MVVGYQQPREKALHRGVRTLTNKELLQLVIGSGSKGASVGRLARQVLRLLHHVSGNGISLENLRAIDGLGVAQSTRILAIFELASRFPLAISTQPITTYSDLYRYLATHEGTIAPDVLYCVFLDGASRPIGMRRLLLRADAQKDTMRFLVTECLSVSAKEVAICASGARLATPLLHTLQSTINIMALLGIAVRKVGHVQKNKITPLYKEVM